MLRPYSIPSPTSRQPDALSGRAFSDFTGDDLDCDSERLQKAVVEVVRKLDHVSFAELPRRLNELGINGNLRGDAELWLPGNIIAWQGFHPDLCEAVAQLLRDGRVFLHPASVLIYFVDGCLLTLRVAKRPPKKGYRNPRWAPSVLRLVPPGKRTGAK